MTRAAGERAVVELVKTQGAVMLVGGYSSSNTLYTAMAADRLGIPFLVSTAADDRITQRQLANVFRLNLPASAHTKGEGLVTAGLWGPETHFRGARAYYDDFVERFQTPPDYHGAEAYSAILVAAAAIEAARDLQPENIRAALAALDTETPCHFQFTCQNYASDWIEAMTVSLSCG